MLSAVVVAVVLVVVVVPLWLDSCHRYGAL